jgi:hypothetical protein
MCNGTEVINIHKYKGKDYTYIGRGSPFGNPFKIGEDGTREEVIEKFKAYFKERLEDPLYKVLVLQLRGNKLGCFCKPKACHGDIIKEWLDGQ